MKVLFTILFLLSSNLVFAETITLKSGAVFEGKIVELTDDSVVIDRGEDSTLRIQLKSISDESLAVLKAIPKITREEEKIVEPAQESPKSENVNLEEKYQQLITEAGDAIAKNDLVLAEEKFKAVIEMNPMTAAEAYYMLAMVQHDLGKYEDMGKNYYKAVALGFKPEPEVEMAMTPYKYREFSVKVKKNNLPFKGSTNCSEQLIMDIIAALKIIGGPENMTLIKPKFLQWGEQGKYWKEEWIVEMINGNKIFSLTLTPTADGGADYKITELK